MIMKKTKQPPSEDRDEVLADHLVELAIALRESDIYTALPEALHKAQTDLRKTIRKCLQQEREQALDEALERTYEEDVKAWRVLRENLEELSGTILIRRDTGAELEVNAFVVPLFVRTIGGLRSEQCFQDEDAFESLRASFQEGGLESRKATVVLVSHAYHLDEIERIGYSLLRNMVHEAADAMTSKKPGAADAIAHSMRGWPPSHFAPDDVAVELRFLLGFTLKSMDDPFYHVPEKEAAADRYFEARAERFRKWSQQVVPLLQRCLVTDGREAEIDFLYQDLFHGGKDAAVAELEMLGLLSDVQQVLEAHGTAPEDVKAAIARADSDDAAVRVSLRRAADDTPIADIEKALARTETMESTIADIADALASVGVQNVRTAGH
ncbi:DUF2863 family protein [Herbaspirillum sp. HC18]|nr:DUF2863 family protein [Herbaspirillum sp. HC18]